MWSVIFSMVLCCFCLGWVGRGRSGCACRDPTNKFATSCLGAGWLMRICVPAVDSAVDCMGCKYGFRVAKIPQRHSVKHSKRFLVCGSYEKRIEHVAP